MNFKKITFTVFVLLLSVCCISTPIFADETVELQYIDPSECSHPSNSMVETSQIQGEFYSAISADQHGYYHKIHRRCVLCGYEEIIDRLIRVENHNFVFEDLGHTGNKHNYRHICYACSYAKNYFLICDGPPHVSPFSIGVVF